MKSKANGGVLLLLFAALLSLNVKASEDVSELEARFQKLIDPKLISALALQMVRRPGGSMPTAKAIFMSVDEECKRRRGVWISDSWSAHGFFGGRLEGKFRGRWGIPSWKRVEALVNSPSLVQVEMPVPERRLVLHIANGAVWTTIVYDRANLPADLAEALRALPVGPDFNLCAWTVQVKANSERLLASDFDDRNAQFSASPDGRLVAFGASYNGVIVADTRSRQIVRAVSTGNDWPEHLQFSPDGRLFVYGRRDHLHVLDTENWAVIREFGRMELPTQIRQIGFPLDNRLLVLGWDFVLRKYGKQNWNITAHSDGLRGDLRWYQLAPDRRHAIVWRHDRSLCLWDVMDGEMVSVLEPKCEWYVAEFSPNLQRIAVLWAPRTLRGDAAEARLRIWSVNTGNSERELWPDDVRLYVPQRCLAWTPDGEYVVGASNLHSSVKCNSRIHLWNARTGHHRANLVSRHGKYNVLGLGIVNGGTELVAGFQNGNVAWWSLKHTLGEVRDFEESLEGVQPAIRASDSPTAP